MFSNQRRCRYGAHQLAEVICQLRFPEILGIACFGLSLVFQLVTLPVEFNASRRALQSIEEGGLLTEEEQRGAKKTLTAAALTYVAATAVALAQLLRLLAIFGGNRRRRD